MASIDAASSGSRTGKRHPARSGMLSAGGPFERTELREERNRFRQRPVNLIIRGVEIGSDAARVKMRFAQAIDDLAAPRKPLGRSAAAFEQLGEIEPEQFFAAFHAHHKGTIPRIAAFGEQFRPHGARRSDRLQIGFLDIGELEPVLVGGAALAVNKMKKERIHGESIAASSLIAYERNRVGAFRWTGRDRHLAEPPGTACR